MRENYIHHAPEYLAIILALILISVFIGSWWLLWITVILGLVLLTFFRGWCTTDVLPGNEWVICPCDGKILDIREGPDNTVHIAVFLNVHNIHVQYMPVAGKIVSIKHIPGTFEPAYSFNKSMFNERVETIIQPTGAGNAVIKVVQIAGMLARRIKSLAPPGAELKQGEAFGLIKLGSRVDLYLPADRVQLLSQWRAGDRIHIGERLAKITK